MLAYSDDGIRSFNQSYWIYALFLWIFTVLIVKMKGLKILEKSPVNRILHILSTMSSTMLMSKLIYTTKSLYVNELIRACISSVAGSAIYQFLYVLDIHDFQNQG
jgi:hypothetical protein